MNERVDVVVLELKGLQLLEAFQFADVGGTGNLVKSHVLEADLLYRLLEVLVVQDF